MSIYNKCKDCGKNCRKEFCFKHAPKDEKLEYFDVPAEDVKKVRALAKSQVAPKIKVKKATAEDAPEYNIADTADDNIEQDEVNGEKPQVVGAIRIRKSRAHNICVKCGKPCMDKYCAAHNRTVEAKAHRAAAAPVASA